MIKETAQQSDEEIGHGGQCDGERDHKQVICHGTLSIDE